MLPPKRSNSYPYTHPGSMVTAHEKPTNNSGFEIHKHRPGHVLARPRLAEERVERVVRRPDGFVGGHLSVGLDPVLQAVQLPARVAHLHARLAHVDADTFSLQISQNSFVFRNVLINDAVGTF